jgi:hypothetical protein
MVAVNYNAHTVEFSGADAQIDNSNLHIEPDMWGASASVINFSGAIANYQPSKYIFATPGTNKISVGGNIPAITIIQDADLDIPEFIMHSTASPSPNLVEFFDNYQNNINANIKNKDHTT